MVLGKQSQTGVGGRQDAPENDCYLRQRYHRATYLQQNFM